MPEFHEDGSPYTDADYAAANENDWGWYLNDYVGNSPRSETNRNTATQDMLASSWDDDQQFWYDYYYRDYVNTMGMDHPSAAQVSDRINQLQQIENEAAALEGRDPEDLSCNPDLYSQVWEDLQNENDNFLDDAASMYALENMANSGLIEDSDVQAVNDALDDASVEAVQEAIKDMLSSDDVPEIDLVHGALLCCCFGTHLRRLYLKKDHGARTQDKSQAHCQDIVAGTIDMDINTADFNIGWFGHCNSPNNSGITVPLETFVLQDQEGNFLEEVQHSSKTDNRCDIELASLSWKNWNKKTSIADSGRGGAYYTPTTKSYIMCKKGGIIYAGDSGQYTVSNSWTPPWLGCPFPEGTDLHKGWCDERGICPYYPGTDDYNEWYAGQFGEDYDAGAAHSARENADSLNARSEELIGNYDADAWDSYDDYEYALIQANQNAYDATKTPDYKSYEAATQAYEDYLWGLYVSGQLNNPSNSTMASIQEVRDQYYGNTPQPSWEDEMNAIKNRYN